MRNMLNKEKHQLIMSQVLKDIYSDTAISSLLGFKGGSSAYFFYGLPRFSVDLDFDLLSVNDSDGQDRREIILKKVSAILEEYGIVKDSYIKRNTVFLLLSYGEGERNIKVEVSARKPVLFLSGCYHLMDYLGVSMLVAKKDYLFASKLTALVLRPKLAMRDVYDIYFFSKNRWEIDERVISERLGKSLKEHLTDCIKIVNNIKEKQVLAGLGELVNDKEKAWLKENLKKETIFMLRNYLSAIK